MTYEEVLRFLKSKPSGEGVIEALKARAKGKDPLRRIGGAINWLNTFLPGNTSLLDAGCYTGYLKSCIRPDIDYTGLDNWAEAIEVAREINPGNYLLADMSDEIPGVYDTVWAAQLSWKDLPHHVIDNLWNATKRYLIIVDVQGSLPPLFERKVLDKFGEIHSVSFDEFVVHWVEK